MMKFFKNETWLESFPKGESGVGRQGLLLLLLVIIAGAGYIFYFTDLIRPVGGTGTQAINASLVKKPMPPRPNVDTAVHPGNPAADKKVDKVVSQKAGAENSAPAKAYVNRRPSPPQHGGSKQTPTKTASAKVSDESAVHTTPPKSSTAKPHASSEPAKSKIKSVKVLEASGQDKPQVKSASNPVKGPYTLQAGVYVMENSMLAVKTKLKSAGLVPVVTKGPKKEEPMNRLFMGEFESYPEAAIELTKIKKITSSAFILQEGGKYTIFAGSFFIKAKAEKERDRLIGSGLSPVIKTANVPVKTYRITAGSFENRNAAETEAGRLKKLGLKVSVVKSGS